MIWVQLHNAFAVFSGQRRSGSPGSSLTANAYSTTNALFFTKGGFTWRSWRTGPAEGLPGSLETYRQRAPGQAARRRARPRAQAALFPKEGLAPDTCACAPPTSLVVRV